MVRCVLLVLCATLALGGAVPATTQAAQQATPQAVPVCGVTPPPVDELIDLAFPQGTPSALSVDAIVSVAESDLPLGALADAAMAAAADQVVQAWLVCHLGGEAARLFALMTDKLDASFLQQLISHPTGDTPEELRDLLESGLADPLIFASNSAIAMTGREVRVLDDGRIGGIWNVGGDKAFIILTEEDGAWLLDEIIDVLDEGTPVAGTPLA